MICTQSGIGHWTCSRASARVQPELKWNILPGLFCRASSNPTGQHSAALQIINASKCEQLAGTGNLPGRHIRKCIESGGAVKATGTPAVCRLFRCMRRLLLRAARLKFLVFRASASDFCSSYSWVTSCSPGGTVHNHPSLQLPGSMTIIAAWQTSGEEAHSCSRGRLSPLGAAPAGSCRNWTMLPKHPLSLACREFSEMDT